MGLAKQMLTAGAINFIYMLLRALSFVVLFWVVYRVFNAMTPGINIPEQLNEKKCCIGGYHWSISDRACLYHRPDVMSYETINDCSACDLGIPLCLRERQG